VSSVPTGAEVSIDNGSAIAHTPDTIEVPCGKRVKLVFRQSGMLAAARYVIGTSAAVDVPRVNMVHLPFTVKISSTPANASITLNGKIVGVTPTALQLPAFATSTLLFSKDGYEPDTEAVTVRTQNYSFHATLKKKKK
jgi:hypothetical protein